MVLRSYAALATALADQVAIHDWSMVHGHVDSKGTKRADEPNPVQEHQAGNDREEIDSLHGVSIQAA